MSYSPYSISGKRILIAGASSGIGRACAVECARMGAVCVLVARNMERLQNTLACLEGSGHEVHSIDLLSEAEIENLVSTIAPIDGLIFSAGTNGLKPIQALKTQDLHTVFSTNLFAPIALTRWLIKKKCLSNGASLVYVASISGNGNTAVGLSAYGASKSALTTFVEYAALELAPKSIRVNAILPGRVNTSFLLHLSEEEKMRDMQTYPLRRYAEPEEIAWAAIYLLSDATKWVTGTSLKIDGGRTLI